MVENVGAGNFCSYTDSRNIVWGKGQENSKVTESDFYRALGIHELVGLETQTCKGYGGAVHLGKTSTNSGTQLLKPLEKKIRQETRSWIRQILHQQGNN